ncbi:MAG: peptide chain release factor N(5)-glutamine methyltransferase [Lachnospiraceae bacterium]|nr:peptide chain release factor N(5)-glutamine methyltransferase [Lachnospiraceae bacterium]
MPEYLTLAGLYRDTAEALIKNAGLEEREAKTEAALLLEFIFGYDRNMLYGHGDRLIDDPEKLCRLRTFLKKRQSHVPLQHLTREQSFMGLSFYVDERVLIPRQDTEFLVEEAMIEIDDGMKVLDLCTGSGCILISLMKYKNNIEGTASDISEDALAVAKENAKRHGLADQITFLAGDLFEGIPPAEKFDAVLSNPPYIRTADIETLMPEVREHDPRLALDGYEDGLYFYRRIITDAVRYLKRAGLLLMEIGYDQGEAVRQLLCAGGFGSVEILKDYAGHDRVAKARRNIREEEDV